MNRALLLTLLFVFTGLFVQAQVYDHKKYIAWNEFYPLSWDNFNGKPAEASFGDAGTAVKIIAKPYLVKKKIYYDVYALFNRQKSWVVEKCPLLLAHEQLHFDIAELYARIARKKISELSARGVDDLKMYNNAIQKILNESNRFDRLYDIETLHGGLKERQKEWETKVANRLKALKEYKKAKRIIGYQKD